MIGSRKPRHPGFVAEDRAAGAGGGGVYREYRDLVAALDQEHAERIDGGGFSDPRRAGDADPDGLAGMWQQRLHQIARCRLMIAAPAFDQRDRPRQRRPMACAQLFGHGLDVEGGIFRQWHALLYNGRTGQARGGRSLCTAHVPGAAAITLVEALIFALAPSVLSSLQPGAPPPALLAPR